MSSSSSEQRRSGGGRIALVRGSRQRPPAQHPGNVSLRSGHYGDPTPLSSVTARHGAAQSGVRSAADPGEDSSGATAGGQAPPGGEVEPQAVQVTGSPLDSVAGGVSAEYFAEISRLAEPRGPESPFDRRDEIRRDSAAIEPTICPEVAKASSTEFRHEIIALGESRLVLNRGNWRRFREMAVRERDRQTLVVSCLGDTSAGKSHTILSLLGKTEEGPYCPPTGAAQGATTFNVNLYQSRQYHPKVTVNFVDYEGENGSETPAMAAARSLHGAGPANVARHRAVRDFFPTLAYTTSDVVMVISREPFTNRQYLTRCVELAKRANRGVQNVDRPALVLVGNKLPGVECHFKVAKSTMQFYKTWGMQASKLDEFFSAIFCFYLPHRGSSWIEPASLAQANGTVGAELPTMPGAPRQVSGELMFQQQLRKIRAVLEGFARERFSKSSGDVVRTGLSSAGAAHGAKDPAEVLGKLGGGELGAAGAGGLDDEESGMAAGGGGSAGDASSEGGSSVKSEAAARRERELSSMHRPRLLTQQSTLWYSLLPAVLRELNNGRGVDVTRLIDQAWTRQLVTLRAGDETEVDSYHALMTYVAPEPALSAGAFLPELERLWRYRSTRSLLLDVAVRLAACRLRWLDPSVLVREKTTRFAEGFLRKARMLVDGMAPCCALYDAEGRGTRASDRPGAPVFCLQERRSHPVHRTCRTVTGGQGVMGHLSFFPYNDTWSGDFKAPTDDALERLERRFRAKTKGRALLSARPTLLGTRAGEEAEEAAVARGEMVDLTSAADLLLSGGPGGVTASGSMTAGSVGDPATPPRAGAGGGSSGSSSVGGSPGPSVASGPVEPAVPLGRRTSKEPSVRSQVKEVLALVALSDREFLEDLLRLQERHTNGLACVGFVPIRRWSRSSLERGAVPALDEVDSGSDSDDDDGDSEEGEGEGEGEGGEEEAGGRRGPGAGGLLKRCSPVTDKVHARLRLLSTLSCSKWMPYCVGCGVKVGARDEGAGDGLEDLELGEGGGLAGGTGGGGLIDGISGLFSWMVGGKGEGDPLAAGAGGLAGSGFGSEVGGGAGATGSELVDDVGLGMSSSEGPSAVGGIYGDSGEASQAGEAVSSASMLLGSSPGRASTGGEAASAVPTRQNLWLGLCKRCWRAAYLDPLYRESARRRGQAPGGDGGAIDEDRFS